MSPLDDADNVAGANVGHAQQQVNVGNVKTSKTISQAERIKINGWDYTPGDELYLKYKDVFDNPKYYNQETRAIEMAGRFSDDEDELKFSNKENNL